MHTWELYWGLGVCIEGFRFQVGGYQMATLTYSLAGGLHAETRRP